MDLALRLFLCAATASRAERDSWPRRVAVARAVGARESSLLVSPCEPPELVLGPERPFEPRAGWRAEEDRLAPPEDDDGARVALRDWAGAPRDGRFAAPLAVAEPLVAARDCPLGRRRRRERFEPPGERAESELEESDPDEPGIGRSA
jgi:hypothetical protein